MDSINTIYPDCRRSKLSGRRLTISCTIAVLPAIVLSLLTTETSGFLLYQHAQRGEQLSGLKTHEKTRELTTWVDNLGWDARQSDASGQLSILSWNILSQALFDKSRHTQTFYEHIPIEAKGFTWRDRLRRILDIIEDADADIGCLQEVELESFSKDLVPALSSLGYEATIQGGDKVKDTKKRKSAKSPRAHLVATFWKSTRFQPVSKFPHLARSRTLTTVLQPKDASLNPTGNYYLAVVNCHLEGHPLKSSARVRQLHHALRDLSNRHPLLHGLVVCGDFNCELQSSACSTYLKVGCCPPQRKKQVVSGVSGDMAMALPSGILECENILEVNEPIMEWGTLVPGSEIESVPAHPFRENRMTSAFPLDLGRDDPKEHFTYAARPGHPVAGLDQIWYNGSTLRSVALRRMFRSDDERCHILETGLPNDIIPSDHLPIGCVMEWACLKNHQDEQFCKTSELVVSMEMESGGGSSVNQRGVSRQFISESEVQTEIQRMLEECPFETDDLRKEFDFVTSDVPGLPDDGKKPSEEQIAQLVERRNRKKKLLNNVSKEAREALSRVIKLKKAASHAAE